MQKKCIYYKNVVFSYLQSKFFFAYPIFFLYLCTRKECASKNRSLQAKIFNQPIYTMKKIFLTLVACASMLGSWAADDQVLLTIDGKPIMASEFMYIYQKNNQESAVEKKSMDEYLEMFINFKLKVAEAESLQLDTTEAFKKELAGYRSQATPKYMQDKEAIDSLVEMSYEHMAHDRRAAHIAIECPMDATEEQVAEAQAKMDAARKRIEQGESFSKVATEVSTLPSTAEDKGELGWIKPFRYIYIMEEAVYNTPVGGLSEVIRSPYGLHMIYVEEEIPHLDVSAAHIMKMVPGGDAALDSLAKQQMDSIYNLLQAGGDFAEIAQKESEDKGSAVRGGDLGWFGRGMMVAPFEDMAYKTTPGEYSVPFRSRFGWHIVKVNGFRAIEPLDSIRDQVVKNVKRDERIKEADKSFIRKTRIEYNLPAEMTDSEVREYADQHLEEKYEDFRHLVQEYHDGILLFDVSLDKVWNKAAQDEEGLANYFAEHKADYKWDSPRWKGYVIYAQDMSHAKAAQAIVKSANKDSIQSFIDAYVNTDSIKYVNVEHGVWAKGKSKAVDQYGFKVKGVEYKNEKQPVVLLVGKKYNSPVEYTDERGKVTSDYQDALEKVWIEELRAKHQVVVNQTVFDQLR